MVKQRGQVWMHERPDDDRRPVLIISRDENAERLLDVVAVPITSNIRGWETEIELSTADGMDRDCVLTLHNTFLVKKINLTHYITTLSAARMTEVGHKLNYATSC